MNTEQVNWPSNLYINLYHTFRHASWNFRIRLATRSTYPVNLRMHSLKIVGPLDSSLPETPRPTSFKWKIFNSNIFQPFPMYIKIWNHYPLDSPTIYFNGIQWPSTPLNFTWFRPKTRGEFSNLFAPEFMGLPDGFLRDLWDLLGIYGTWKCMVEDNFFAFMG